MRLKYYLRGLGLGIIFAVFIMMVGYRNHGSSMSDSQIIEKAKALGMVETEDSSGMKTDNKTVIKLMKKSIHQSRIHQRQTPQRLRIPRPAQTIPM